MYHKLGEFGHMWIVDQRKTFLKKSLLNLFFVQEMGDFYG